MNGNKSGKMIKKKFQIKNYMAQIALVILIVISAILSKTFLLPNNIINIMKQISPTGLMAFGMTCVILTGGIDLSVGSVMAVAGIIVAQTIGSIGLVPSILLAFLFALVTGLIFGLMITKLNVPPFIATLAGMNIWRGVALVKTGAAAIPIVDPAFNSLGTAKVPALICYVVIAMLAVLIILSYLRGQKKQSPIILVLSLVIIAIVIWLVASVKGLNIQIIIFLCAFCVVFFVLEKTVFGRQVYAVGGNLDAARLSGIKVNKVLSIVYMISAFCAALCGVLTAARLGSGVPQAGQAGEMDAIAATVIGGVSMTGGVGRVTGTIVGIFLIGVLNNLLTLLGVSSDMQLIFKGAIVAGAVILDTYVKK